MTGKTMAQTPSKTATTDKDGVLAECIMQPASNSPQYTANAYTCEIRLKGPYDVLKDVNDLQSKELPAALQSMPIAVSKNFDIPAAPKDTKWIIAGTSVEQLEAGDHAVMTLTCNAVDSNQSQTEVMFDPYQDTWQLRWESYTVRPAGFCKNEPHEDKELTSMTGSYDLTGFADRQHIHYFMEAGKDNCGYSEQIEHYWYRTQDGDFVLNDAEEAVLKKTLQDRSALYHYPVLTHTTVENHFVSNISSVISSNVKYNYTIGDKIDYLIDGDKPDGCPYSFPSGNNEAKWQWIKTGDDMQHMKTKNKISFQRTETFMGVISADANYYGNKPFDHDNLDTCRWKIGEV